MRTCLTLLLLISEVALAQGFTVRGELGLDTGVRVASASGAVSTDVPVVVRALVDMDSSLGGDTSFRAVLLPAFGSGAQRDEPLASPGLQEAYFELRSGRVDLSAGFQRLPLAQMRLLEPLNIEPRLETGEPRGPLSVRALAYAGAWRARTALIGITGGDLVPEGLGGLASLRHESTLVTVEAHALWTVRPAVGITASASVDALVVYGEAWLLADPWAGRGGAGVTGYLGEWLWTAEAAWAPADGGLRSPVRPAVAVNFSRPIGFDASVDATVVGSWPRSLLDPQRRVTQLDAAVSLRQDQGDASLTFTPAFHLSEGVVAGSLGLSLRAYY